MAAAYASIITLNYQIIEQIRLHHTRRRTPNYSSEQLQKVESLSEITTFLQELLENCSDDNELMEMLENRIRKAADKAQDIIESYVQENLPSEQTFKGLDEVIEDMNSIKEELEEVDVPMQDLVHPDPSARPLAGETDKPTVDLEGRVVQILDKLVRGGESDRPLTISITGMAGIGKTTLAKKVYRHSYSKSFDFCAWVTISQVYSIEAVLLVLVEVFTNESDLQRYNWHELGVMLHKHLMGRRCLIVMDDLWDTDIWDKLKRFIPDNKRSRILVTTRLMYVANYINSSGVYKMEFLDENESWSLLCKSAFGQECCPYPEFDEVLKRIAKNCKGLPLSIAVIAELFAKSNLTRELLELVVNDTNQTIISVDNGYVSRMLLLSYNHLPIHLKPCLLYMGSYLDDHKIHVSTLINLWVAEGFLKPNKLKTFEEVGEGYLKDLVESNLVMVDELGTTGGMKNCVIHDLVKVLCLKESNRGEFLCFTKMHYDEVPLEVYKQQHRRIVLHNFERKDLEDRTKYVSFLKYLKSIPNARSLAYRNLPYANTSKVVSDNLKLLKVFSMFDQPTSHLCQKGDVQNFSSLKLYNLRYIDAYLNQRIPSLNRIRNLQTVCIKVGVLDKHMKVEKFDIWKLLELRHLKSSEIYLSNLSSCGPREEYVLENLQTLTEIVNFELTEEVLERIPNVQKLALRYRNIHKDLSFNILNRLEKLESLKVRFSGSGKLYKKFFRKFCGNLYTFPSTLKKLHLEDSCRLDAVISNIGQLPNLEKLTLEGLVGDKWDSVDEQFNALKYLCIRRFKKESFVWTAESSHFPALEHLIIGEISLQIPFDFAYSTTLRSIHLESCWGSKTLKSANEIYEEHKSFNDIENWICVTEN